LDRLYQADILYELSETIYMQKIESLEFENFIQKINDFLNEYRYWNPYVLNARMFIGEEKILIKQKVVELINRRNNGK
jgi:hypothetical protein